jgi:polysaccharide biosynthesis transport protein
MLTESDSTGGGGGTFNWREYYQAIVGRLWLPAIGLILGAGLSVFLISKHEDSYHARAVLFIEEQSTRVLDNMKPLVDEQFHNADMINTMVDILGGFPFALKVTERLKLNSDYAFLSSAGISKRNVSAEEAARILVGMVKARYREGTRLLDITVTNRVADEARLLANSYAEEYLRYVLERRADATRNASQSLIQEAERLRVKMRASEEAMQNFRERERTASLENLQEEAQTKLTEITAKTTQLEDQLLQLNRDLAAAKVGTHSPEDLLRLPSVANDPRVSSLTASISEQERAVGVLSQRYRAKHPTYIAAKSGLQFSINERNAILQDAIKVLEIAVKQTDSQLEHTRVVRSEYEQHLLSITAKAIEYNDLKREIETDSAMYNAVLERLKEVDVTRSLNDAPVQIHELATASTADLSSPLKTIAGCIIAGVLAGLGVAVGLHFLDQSVKSVDDAENISGLSVFSAVPLIKGSNGEKELIAFKKREGLAAEAFRTLRAALTSRDRLVDGRRIFLFTSPLPGEGKTFSSSNFAVTLAQQGLRTLLIDADLRRPGIARLFSNRTDQPGLTDVLSGMAIFSEALTPVVVPNLSVLTAGHMVNDPSELLGTKAFDEFLEAISHEYDRIVIDSTPCLVVSDTLLLARRVDVCCLVVRAFATPKSILKRAVKVLSEAHCQPAGLILNCLPSDSAGYYPTNYFSRNGDGVHSEQARVGV